MNLETKDLCREKDIQTQYTGVPEVARADRIRPGLVFPNLCCRSYSKASWYAIIVSVKNIAYIKIAYKCYLLRYKFFLQLQSGRSVLCNERIKIVA